MTPTVEWLGPLPSGNYAKGRAVAIDRIVDHWTVGSLESAIARFKDPTANVSAHYIVARAGRIVQLVAETDTAYHAGDWPMNRRSIGIEHEGAPDVPFTDEQYASSAWLHRRIAASSFVDLDTGVIRHRDVVPTQCPGPLDLARIVKAAKEVDAMRPERIAQSADLTLQPGEVGWLSATWRYGAADRTFSRKVVGYSAGRRVYTLYPPVDPDADPTEDVSADPAIFTVDTTV